MPGMECEVGTGDANPLAQFPGAFQACTFAMAQRLAMLLSKS
jgi:hypothetical protein